MLGKDVVSLIGLGAVLALSGAGIAARSLTPVVIRQSESKGAVDSALVELAERVQQVSSFSAVYRMETDGESRGTARLVYQAPDRARFEVQTDDVHANIWAADGVLTTLSEMGDESYYARVGCADLLVQTLSSEVERLLQQQFPSSKTQASESEPRLSFGLETRAGDSSDKARCSFRLNFTFDRECVLAWLDRARQWPVPTMEQDGTRFYELEEGPTIALSMETGFLEEIGVRTSSGAKKTMRLESLELDSSLDDAEFESGARPDGVQDRSYEMERSLVRSHLMARRGRVFTASYRLAEQRGELDDDIQERLSQVLTAHHAEVVRDHCREWADEVGSRIDGYLEWYAEAYKATSDDPQARASLAEKTRTWREALQERLLKSVDAYVERLDEPRLPEGKLKMAIDVHVLGPIRSASCHGTRIRLAASLEVRRRPARGRGGEVRFPLGRRRSARTARDRRQRSSPPILSAGSRTRFAASRSSLGPCCRLNPIRTTACGIVRESTCCAVA